jgi:hypothetical protein
VVSDRVPLSPSKKGRDSYDLGAHGSHIVNVLCIDTDPETTRIIAVAGHVVVQGDIGYRTGRPNLLHPPHEYDVLICDLRHPACFDVTYWGPGKNDNFHCKIDTFDNIGF